MGREREGEEQQKRGAAFALPKKKRGPVLRLSAFPVHRIASIDCCVPVLADLVVREKCQSGACPGKAKNIRDEKSVTNIPSTASSLCRAVAGMAVPAPAAHVAHASS